jgi:hypothetical protein
LSGSMICIHKVVILIIRKVHQIYNNQSLNFSIFDESNDIHLKYCNKILEELIFRVKILPKNVSSNDELMKLNKNLIFK